jgi:hypothetical protein
MMVSTRQISTKGIQQPSHRRRLLGKILNLRKILMNKIMEIQTHLMHSEESRTNKMKRKHRFHGPVKEI